MAGSMRFDFSSGGPEDTGFVGGYGNGQRRNFSGPNFERSGSLKEGTEKRGIGPAVGTSRGSARTPSDVPLLSQCLALDPILTSDHKFTKSSELRRAMGLSLGNNSEASPFGPVHSKPINSVVTDEMKKLKSILADACHKARGRSKRFDELLHKLNKFSELSSSKKHQRNDLLSSERPGGSNPLKMGLPIHRNTSEISGQRLEERSKNMVLNKRVRTSVAETRAEGRSSISHQSFQMGKDRDAVNNSSDISEEKIRRLPAGGEGWDKKMKRKRSVGSVFTKPAESDGELKRILQPKLGNDQGLQSCEPNGFRTGSYNSSNGINKLDGNSFSLNCHTRGTPKSEFEKVHISRDIASGLIKERVVSKVNNRSTIRDDSPAAAPLPKTKGKASRAPRMGTIVAECSSPDFSRPSGTLDCSEESQNLNKGNLIGGTNRKRSIPTGPSSPPMAQWVGQRPHKISRTRRTNLVYPVSSHDETQVSSEGCPPQDFVTDRVISGGVFHAKDSSNLIQHKSKHENVSSATMMSESEDSGVGEDRSKDKGMGSSEIDERSTDSFHNMGNSMSLSTKNKMFIREDVADGLRRQGRTGRSLSISRATISSNSEKMENPVIGKPVRSSRPTSDKNGSKLGRPPLKKMSDRKAFSRLGQQGNDCTPDLTGESEDDHEELVAAAKCANSGRSTPLNPFWMKMDPIFASVNVDDITFLNKQVKNTDELVQNSSLINGYDSNNVKSVEEDASTLENGISYMFDDPFQEINDLSGHLNSGIDNITPPLYQRVLSALILNDETKVFEEKSERRNGSMQFDKDESCYPCLDISVDCGKREVTGPHYDSLGFPEKQSTRKMFSLNGCSGSDYSPLNYDPPCADDISQEGHIVMCQRGKPFREYSQNGLNGFHEIHPDVSTISSCDFQYEHMPLDDKVLLELQSIGLLTDAVPDLSGDDDEVIVQEIAKLKKKLHVEVSNKKGLLDKLCKSFGERKEMEDQKMEHTAMDKLVELAYKKQQTNTSKNSTTKASKQVTLAFVKRTLARCRRFENDGENCFSDPALREIVLAPSSRSDADFLDDDISPIEHPGSMKPGICPLSSAGMPIDVARRYVPQGSRCLVDGMRTLNCLSDQTFIKNGSICMRGKKKEVFIDDVGGNSAFHMSSSSLCNTLSGGIKGKRSDRERDRDTFNRNSTAKLGRPSLGSIRGDRKAKPKPRQQKTSQLTTPGNKLSVSGPLMGSAVHPAAYPSVTDSIPNRKEGVLVSSSNNTSVDPVDFTNLQLQELDSMGDLGVGAGLGGHQDLSSWLNFDEDGLQDHDSMGLEIPMDDLSELNMIL